MFWISLAVITMSTLLVKLGAMSVQVAVQAVALKAVLVVFLILAVLTIWRMYK
jgi:hypothetical protein